MRMDLNALLTPEYILRVAVDAFARGQREMKVCCKLGES